MDAQFYVPVFEIKLNQCGMQSSGGLGIQNNGQPNPAGSYIDTTIIIQYDPLVQEVFDQARKLRCTWYDYYEKSVTFRPFQVWKESISSMSVIVGSFLCFCRSTCSMWLRPTSWVTTSNAGCRSRLAKVHGQARCPALSKLDKR